MPPESGGADSGAQAHFRALESLYAAAPINQLFKSRLEIQKRTSLNSISAGSLRTIGDIGRT